jgi:hypothetical protein
MASWPMRIVVLGVVIAAAWGRAPRVVRGAEDGVTPASHAAAADAPSDAAGGDGALDRRAFDRETFNRVAMVRELMKRRGGEPAAAAQLVQLVRTFEPADAFAAYEDLAVAHERAGQLNLAAEARLMAVQAYPQERAARSALLWLTRLYASCEVAHRYRPVGQELNPDDDRGAALYAYQLAGSVPSGGGAASDNNPRRGDPALVFARAVAARRAGVPKAAGTLLATLKHAKEGNPWGDCARVEAWLEAGAVGEVPKGVIPCVRATEAPRLDGMLDEACWAPVATSESAESLEGEAERAKPPVAADLRRAAEERPTADVRWASDGEYLYIAVRCAKAAGVAYPRDERGRTRDAELEAFDRVRLLIDIDRDYATCFELTIDSRGWTRDACWGDATWNPEWFVAAGETDGEWTAEAAIGLDQLAAKGQASGAVWAVAVERALPVSKDAQRANPRAANQRPTPGPEAFDVLIFK